MKKVWKPKREAQSRIAHTSFRVSSIEYLHFDSGCSRHMTGEKTYLDTIKPYTNNYVPFGVGEKLRIKGIGKLVYADSLSII